LAIAIAILAGGASACGNVAPAHPGDGGGNGGAGGGSGAGSDAPADSPPTAEDACMREADAVCSALSDCAMPWVQFLYGDKDTCVMRLGRSCIDEQSAAGITRTTNDLVACAEAVKRASCPDLLASKFPDACLVKPGTIANGLACGSDWQCADAYCNKPSNSDCGVCGPRSAAGGTCTADDGCQTGMVCANKKCVLPGDMGAGCGDAAPCRSNLYCANNVCGPKLGAGGACTTILSGTCDIYQGYVCNTLLGAGQCTLVTVKKGGEACGGGTATVCMDFNPCAGSTANQTGVCANPAADGTQCGTTGNDPHCLPPANCVNGLCRLPSVPSCK
jgi:hypothetical protein